MLGFTVRTIAFLLALAYFQAPILVWAAAVGLMLASWAVAFDWSALALWAVFVPFAVVAAVLTIPALRRKVLSDPVLAPFRRILPDMSQTEKEGKESSRKRPANVQPGYGRKHAERRSNDKYGEKDRHI